MFRRRFLGASAALPLSGLLSPAAAQSAADFPTRPIRLILAFPAGGSTDITMRQLAENAGRILGQPVIIDNKPGASGTLPAQQLQTVAADGYTVAQIPLGVFRIGYTTKIHWDPIKDISYVLNVTGYPFGVVVSANGPLKSWADFIAYAKANPGRLSYGTSGNLTSPNLTMSQIALAEGVELQHIPYKGNADMLMALVGGQIMAGADSTGWAPYVDSGKLRLLNTWGAKRMPKYPNVPTLQELGYGLVQASPFGIGAPGRTPPAIVAKLHDAFKQAMEEPSYLAALERYDMLPDYKSSAAYAQFAKDTVATEKVLIERLGLARQN